MDVEKVLQYLKLDRKEFSQSVSLITQDSRRVVKNAVFFALRGSDEVKIKNLNEAEKKDARLLIHNLKGFDKGLFVSEIHRLYSDLLKLYYEKSFMALKIYGVTGTNGKTTYSYMLKNLLETYNVPTGIFGTVENAFGDNKLTTGLTSPIAEDFYAFNDENYHKHGMKALVCEVSSHALDQKRMGLGFLDGACFTSFSQDHLDYHKSMEEYLKAKLKIKTEASKKKSYFCATKNLKELLEDFEIDLLNQGNFKIKVKKSDYGQEVEFSSILKKKSLKGFLPMIGEYNAENFGLALMTLCYHFGDDFFPDERVFKNFMPPPGRMETIFHNKLPLAYIDYSHTPDSLEKALKTLKNLNKKLIVVFGCGGNRDQSKRPKMGKVASEHADYTYLTSDNPRDEDPHKIIDDIVLGLNTKDFAIEVNRGDAIKSALSKALKENAIVLIAGKGHERTQEIAGEKKTFSDVEEVKQWVIEHGN